MNNKLILHKKVDLDIYIKGHVYIVPCVLVEEVGGGEPEILAYTLSELGIIGTGMNSEQALVNLANMFRGIYRIYAKKDDADMKSSAVSLKKLILSLRKNNG